MRRPSHSTGRKDMSDLNELLQDLVTANRILAHEGVVDAYGHVSFRHPQRPDRFFLSGSRSPELVTLDDLIEYDLDCAPIDQRGRAMYSERPIHGAIYQARPEVTSVVHNHAHEVIPFGISKTVKLRPVLHTAAGIGSEIRVWDIRDKFGDTNLLVTKMDQGHDLAAALGPRSVVLMRGHGCAVAGESLYEAVHKAVYLKVNAKLQTEAMRFGEITYLSDGEIAEMSKYPHDGKSRAWEYWTERSGAARP
jgi:ribulose-5-phosphate 4-epimerase/fuculose-1-phosphate aldolase